MIEKPLLDPERIEPVTRRVYSATGTVVERERIYCPARREMGWVDGCLSCTGCDGLVEGLRERYVRCRLSMSEDSPQEKATVSQACKPQVVCVRKDLTVPAAQQLLRAERLHAVGVVDALGRLVGIVTRGDLAQPSPDSEGDSSNTLPFPGLNVGQVMSTPVVAVRERTSLATAVALMSERRVNQLPVVDASSQLLGMVTALDAAACLARR